VKASIASIVRRAQIVVRAEDAPAATAVPKVGITFGYVAIAATVFLFFIAVAMRDGFKHMVAATLVTVRIQAHVCDTQCQRQNQKFQHVFTSSFVEGASDANL
jgi:hypothetical protein